jgi:uncharacterized membrane protein YfcA
MIFLICIFAFLAGFIDSVAGGGGLIQLPALMILYPQTAVPVLLGTNKFSSFFGTSVAVTRYSKRVKIPWKIILSGMLSALVFSFLGARVVHLMPSYSIRPVIIVILLGVFIFTFVRKNFGSHAKNMPFSTSKQLGVLAGCAIIGFYDGFLGPGTGGFLIFFFVSYLGMNFLQASASAKIVNWGTNATALIYFLSAGLVHFQIAVPMAAANIAGNFIGTHFAIKKGVLFIRFIFLWVVCLILLKLAYDSFVR